MLIIIYLNAVSEGNLEPISNLFCSLGHVIPKNDIVYTYFPYRVGELVLDIVGAKATTDNKYLQMRIESTGEFHGRSCGKTNAFLTKPLLLAFEYHLETG